MGSAVHNGAIRHWAIRQWYGIVCEIKHEGGPAPSQPLVKTIAAAVLENPCAGGYETDLSALVDPSARLGAELARRGIALADGRKIESFGKGAIAGVAGEQEHAVACITTPFGNAVRKGVGGGAAWISSATKVGSAGEPLDIPLAFKDELYVRSHYDTVTLRIPDAPRPHEIVVAVAFATAGRVHHRLGGPTKAEALEALDEPRSDQHR